MVRLLSSRSIASLLLLCVAVQAHPAARLHMRQDGATSTDLDPAPTDAPTETDGLADPSGTDAEAPAGTETSVDETPTDAPEDTASSSSDSEGPTPTEDAESSSVTESESSTTEAPTPSAWVSVNETDGRISTIVPSVTESDGVTRTIDLPDPDHTGATDPGNGEPASFLPTCDSTKYQGGGKYAPFCLPVNDTHMYFKQTYYITWDPAFWPEDNGNNTIEITANYPEDPEFPERGRVAFDSGIVLNKLGFITFYVDPDKFADGAVVQWQLKRHGNQANIEKSFRHGPVVGFTNEPIHHPMPAERPPVSTLGLAVGIPLAILFILIVVAGLFFCGKKKRSIGGIVIPTMRRKRAEAYAAGKSRGRRGGAAAPPGYRDDVDAKAAAWEMGNMKSPDTPSRSGPYQDEPQTGAGIRGARGGGDDVPQNPFSDRYQGN